MPGDPYVVVRDLVVEFRSGEHVVRPLDGLSIDVGRGSLTLLLGPSGCGKTTLLSCLGAILAPTAGTVRVGGLDVTRLRGDELTAYRRRGVGIVFQAFNLIDALTVTENVMVPLEADRERRAGARDRAVELARRVGLDERLGHRPDQLSGGQQQRVAIARAIAHDPPLVLADEPTAHLDHIQVEGILRLLGGLAAEGRAVVVSTHDDRLLPLADQVVDLHPRTAAPVPEAVRDLHLAAGEVLFRQEDLSDVVYVVRSGQVEVVREGPDGALAPLAVVGPGRHLGEMGPLFGLRRSATARAVTDTTVTAMSVPAFREWLGDRPLHTAIADPLSGR